MGKCIIAYGGGGGLDTDELTATADNVLEGKLAGVNGSDEPVEGTMPNNGAVVKSLNCGDSYTIAKGYHDGNGKITANTLASQTSGTATAADILTGKTAVVNGATITGTMTNNGAKTSTLGAGGSYTIPAGYHNGSGKISVQSLATITSAGTVTSNAQILNGYKAYSDGTLYTGSIASLAGSTITPSSAQQTVSCSGKYMTSNIVVSAIPSTYVNITGSYSLFKSGTFGALSGGAIKGYRTTPLQTSEWNSETGTYVYKLEDLYNGQTMTVGNTIYLSSNLTSAGYKIPVFAFKKSIKFSYYKYVKLIVKSVSQYRRIYTTVYAQNVASLKRDSVSTDCSATLSPFNSTNYINCYADTWYEIYTDISSITTESYMFIYIGTDYGLDSTTGAVEIQEITLIP